KAGLEPTIYSGDYKFDYDLANTLTGVKFKVLRSWLDKAGFSIMPKLPSLAREDLKNYDVIHMHVYRTFQNIILYRYCKKYKIPFVMDAHGSLPYYKKKNFIKKLYDKLWGTKMLKDACLLIAETRVGVDEYLDLDPDLDKEKIVVLSPPFDTDEYEVLPVRGEFRMKYSIPNDERVIMFLGRVHHIKGNDFLIKGFAEYAKKDKNSRLVIVGPDDGHMDTCKQLAKELEVSERVLFTGFLGGEHKNSALVDADIVVQLSRQEQGAWAPLEAVLCGTPIIVTSHTGTGEDIKRLDAGYLIDFDDIRGLSAMFEYIFTNYDEAKDKTIQAKKYVEDNLSMNTRVGEYTNLYKRCLQ
ncbi:MAG: glycosyltransferase, partial [Gammaproteobacteria bacterium]|nr:glycosyltransferase [Gammaproteobacteria bacterium]